MLHHLLNTTARTSCRSPMVTNSASFTVFRLRSFYPKGASPVFSPTRKKVESADNGSSFDPESSTIKHKSDRKQNWFDIFMDEERESSPREVAVMLLGSIAVIFYCCYFRVENPESLEETKKARRVKAPVFTYDKRTNMHSTAPVRYCKLPNGSGAAEFEQICDELKFHGINVVPLTSKPGVYKFSYTVQRLTLADAIEAEKEMGKILTEAIEKLKELEKSPGVEIEVDAIVI